MLKYRYITKLLRKQYLKKTAKKLGLKNWAGSIFWFYFWIGLKFENFLCDPVCYFR